VNYLLALLGGLQLSDGVMTDFLVKNNVVQEGNRIMAPLVSNGSFLVLKIVGAVCCIVALKLLSKRFSKAAFVTGSLVVAFYCGVIAWNIGVAPL
jgi:hypothetical protein